MPGRRRSGAAYSIQFPTTQVLKNYGWYMDPYGATGAEAIVYLPAYNAQIRASQQKGGLRLLSQCSGEMMGSGEEKLIIEPPTIETCTWICDELKRRQGDQRDEWQERVDEIQEKLDANGFDGKERAQHANVVRQLKHRINTLKDGIPTPTALMRFFIQEHTIRLGMEISADMRASLAAVNIESQWKQIGADLDRLEQAGAKSAAKKKEPEAAVA